MTVTGPADGMIAFEVDVDDPYLLLRTYYAATPNGARSLATAYRRLARIARGTGSHGDVKAARDYARHLDRTALRWERG